MILRSIAGILIVGLCMTLATARSQTTQTPASASGPSPPVAGSLQEVMVAHVNPTAAAVWESSSSASTSAGFVDNSPKNAADWAAVDKQAHDLIDAAGLLLQKSLPIAKPGARLQDAELPDNRNPAQIRAAIDANPERFAKLVRRLQNSVKPTLAAIQKKDADALVIAGGEIDEACDACHLVYWYPPK